MRLPPHLTPYPSGGHKITLLLLILFFTLLYRASIRPSPLRVAEPVSFSNDNFLDEDFQLVATSAGRVMKIHVNPGDIVHAGQVVATLSSLADVKETPDAIPSSTNSEFVNTLVPDAPTVVEPVQPESPPEISLPYCDEQDHSVRVYYLHPDRILRNGAPCLPSTRLESNPSDDVDYVKKVVDEYATNPKTPYISCQGRNLRVATAANDAYFPNLLNFIGSVHYWEPNISVVVYNLGLSPEQISTLKQVENVDVRRLPLEKLPPYFAEFQTYAFKPLLFLDALRTFPEPCLFWQDAGQEFRRPISTVRNVLQRKGFFLAKTGFQHPTPYTHPNHIVFFGLTNLRYMASTAEMRRNPEYRGLWECAGGIIGVTRNAPILQRVVLPWAACTFYRSCISPEGTDRTNDRQDQTALNLILYYRRWKTGAIPGSKLTVNGQVVPMLPENNHDMFALESAKGKGMGLVDSDPTVLVHNVVLFSRKRYPPYIYNQFVRYK